MNGYFVGGGETYGVRTLESLLGSNTEANMMRLKATLLGYARTPIERKIVGFLCDGYKEMDIRDTLKVSRQYVNAVIQRYRKRLKAWQIEIVFSIIREG